MKGIREFIRDVLTEIHEFNNGGNFVPTDEMARVAKSALEAIQKNNLTQSGGNQGSGKSKAESLSKKEPQTHSMVKRMKAWFDANRNVMNQDKIAGKNMTNSGIMQSWNLWGGDAADRWAKKTLETKHGDNLGRKKVRRDAGGAGQNKGMGTMSINTMDTTNTRIHR